MILHRARILAWLAWDAASFFTWLAKRPWYTELHLQWVNTLSFEVGTKALEVGCGPGLLSVHLSDRGVKVTGIDRSAAMVERAQKNLPGATFIEGDAMDLPLAGNTMDVAFGASVVNVVPEPQKLIQELTRVVRHEGQVSVLFPTPRLGEKTATIAKHLGIEGLSAAALETWGAKAPKREPSVIKTLFENAGLHEISTELFFEDTIASVSGRVGTAR